MAVTSHNRDAGFDVDSAGPDTTSPAGRATRRKARGTGPVGTTLRYLGAFGIILSALFPILWLAISGFKARTEVVKTPFQFFPEVWQLDNYLQIAEDPTFTRTLVITFAGATIFTLLSLTVNSMAAYVFARIDFPFKRTLWVVVIMTMFIPWMAILITSYLVVAQLRMLDTLAVLILPPAASAAHIFLMRQYYLTIPTSIEDAALIDGCGRWKIFRYIFLPMSKPVFVVVGVMSFMAFWNSYVWPVMTITSRDLFQVQQYLATFRSEERSELGLLMAGSMLAALPVIVVFLIFQRHIVAGIKLSGIK
jgi:multiple sugar transport system permease protein